MIKNVCEYLENSAQRFPNKIAFSDIDKEITFLQLREQAMSIASAFAKRGLFKQPILVALPKDIRSISVFLGAAYSGNFYSPLDIEMPSERVVKLLDKLQPSVIVTDNESLKLLLESGNDRNKILLFDDIVDYTIEERLLQTALDKQIDSDILYVLFTSGSTGMPKGACITHRSVISYTEFVAEEFDMDENVTFGQAAQFTFDTTIRNIYQTIRNGGTNHIIPKDYLGFPGKCIPFLDERKVNTIFWTPTLLSIVAKSRILEKRPPQYISRVIFSGEMMPSSTLNSWIDAFPNASFLNVYGATEVGDTCSYYRVERKLKLDEPLPIGYHDRNVALLLLDNEDECKQGEIGEICVRGSKISHGYYNDLEKTAESFVQNPLNKNYFELIYRTGDLGYYNENDELVLVGRKDFQIKHSGFRIELGEIESRAEKIEDVNLCACVYDNEKKQILLFYTGNVDKRTIKTELKSGLQSYMMPHKIIKLDDMPRLPSGKIDRTKLITMIPEGL